MKLVVDANILFAALIRQNATFLLLFEDDFDLYVPEFIFDELALHRDEILRKTSATPADFEATLALLARRFHRVPLSAFAVHVKDAKDFSPDPKDAVYPALAIHLGNDVAVWSNDKRLKSQDRVAVVSTSDLIELIYRRDPYAQDAPES